MALWGRLITPFFIFSAFLILLFVSLSAPIIKSIYLFEVKDTKQSQVQTSTATSVRFGLWGYCVGAYEFETGHAKYVAAIDCTKPSVGYTISGALIELIGNVSLITLVMRSLTVVLILHPVAAILAFLTLAGSLLYAYRPRVPHCIPICTLLLAILPCIVITISFALDLIIIVIVRAKVEAASNGGLTVSWGNAVWMIIGALVAMWLSIVGLSAIACGCFGLGGMHRTGASYGEFIKAQLRKKDEDDPSFGPVFLGPPKSTIRRSPSQYQRRPNTSPV